ncbi:MAG: response regulator transcription factor [Abitibacteriaceae bacterium]|nr:response regulator transcription factor [Abditibacteriaceae bacterium]
MSPISTLLVDDSKEFLQAIAEFLRIDGRLSIVGAAQSGQEALVQVARLQPRLVLMDWQMPGMNGLEATRHLQAQPNAPWVVILTQHDYPVYRAVAQEAGAVGFMTKTDFVDQLSATITLLAEQDQPQSSVPNDQQ